jgi:hypothetical protein
MSIKLKVLGLGVLAIMAVSAFAAMNATAETGGHFVSDSPTGSTAITGREDATDFTELTVPGLTGIVCTTATYEGTAAANTVTELTITPHYSNCHTTGSATAVTVHVNGCDYQFTIGKKSTADNTVDIVCPAGKQIEVTHEGCTIKIPPANGIKGVAYQTITTGGKHAITLGVTLSGFTMNFEAGFCVLLGTSHTATISGSVIVEGWEDLGNDATHLHGKEGARVNITATGSEG